MKRMINVLLGSVAVIAAVLIVLISWRLYDMNMKQNLQRAIHEAWSRSYSDDMPEYLKYIELQSGFEIETIEKGEPWVITVTVNGIDVGGELKNVDPALFSGDSEQWEMDQYLIDLAKKAELTQVTAIVYVWREDGDYRIQFSETFVDAMTGGVYSYTLELIEEMTGGSK